MSIPITDVLPPAWRGYFAASGRVAIGADLGTTTRAKSNPTAIAVCQITDQDTFTRLLLRFKTDRPEITEQLLQEIITGVASRGLRVGRVCIDATSERFFAAQLKARLRGQASVELVISSAAVDYLGQSMNYKTYLGNFYLNAIDDGRLVLPNAEWVERDARQVKIERGRFDADVDEEGNHADGFDAVKLALHALRTHGTTPAEASPAAVGNSAGLAQQGTPATGWRNPYQGRDTPTVAI